MQVGSIVEVIETISEPTGEIILKKGDICVIRNIQLLCAQGGWVVNVEVEEVDTPKLLKCGLELIGFNKRAFKELLPPQEVKIEELLHEPQIECI